MTATEPRIDELRGVLDRLDRILARAVQRLVHVVGDQAAADPFRGLYISVQDASRMAQGRRWSPLLGVAEEESPITAVLDPGWRLAALAEAYALTGFDLDVLDDRARAGGRPRLRAACTRSCRTTCHAGGRPSTWRSTCCARRSRPRRRAASTSPPTRR